MQRIMKEKPPSEQIDTFFKKMEEDYLALTYNDVRLHTDYSDVMPRKTNLRSRITRNIELLVPFVSSPMDTVTEAPMAIAMALQGGLGIIHRGLSPHAQVKEVAKVKYYLNGLIERPICVSGDEVVGDVLKRRERKGYRFHRFPVVNKSGKLVGIVTKDNFDLCVDSRKHIRDIMTPLSKLKTAPPGTTLEQAYTLMQRHGKKAMPLVDSRGKLVGMYVFSDVERIRSGRSMHNTDAKGHLRVGAAVGAGKDFKKRAALLAKAGCDLFHIDTAHGASRNVLRAIRYLKKHYQHTDVLAGNVSNGKCAKLLVDAGADGVCVGQGPGSICTTRMIAGIGVPQVSAVYDCVRALRGTGVPVCADGGVTNSGDVVVAIAIGAESVMVGRALAGTDESPGEVRTVNGVRWKLYRGMGSLGAMRANASSRNRYKQAESGGGKLVPEGVEGSVPYQGPLGDVLGQYIGGLQAGLGYLGARTVRELQQKARIFRITNSGLAESKPHDIVLNELPPNYRG